MQGPQDLERILAQREYAKAVARAKVRTVAEAIDSEGQVTVWVKAAGTYQRLWPVDAAELIARGAALLKGQEPEPQPEPRPGTEPDSEPEPEPQPDPAAKSAKPARKGKTPPAAEAPRV
jgi:hypothetical protein